MRDRRGARAFSRVLFDGLRKRKETARSLSTIHLREAEEKQNGFCRYIVTSKATLWFASYSACVVYTKTIIHLSVGESGGYLPRRGGSVNIHHYSPPLR